MYLGCYNVFIYHLFWYCSSLWTSQNGLPWPVDCYAPRVSCHCKVLRSLMIYHTIYIHSHISTSRKFFLVLYNFVHLFPDKWLRMSTSFRWHPQPRTWVCTGVPVTRTVSTRSSTPYQIWTPVSPSAQRSTSQRNRSIPGQSKPQTCQTLLEKWDEFSVYVLFWHWTYILIFINQDQGGGPGVQLTILPHWEAEGARAACCAWGHH